MTDNDAIGENTYFLDAESPVELVRLINLDFITTNAMGGPLVGVDDPASLRNVLDLGCGPGGWVLSVAFDLPTVEVEGADISRIMVDYANARAGAQQLPNASFGVMDITQTLDFPDASFDLVNARFLVGVLPSASWPGFIAECTRVLRPGGILRLTEMIDAGVSSSPAFEQLQYLLYQSFQRAGYGFSADGRTLGITHVLPSFLRKAGYQDVRRLAHTLEFSMHTASWLDFYRNAEIGYKLSQAFFAKTGIATQEESEKLYRQMLIEFRDENFCGMWHYITFLGTKSV